MITLLALKNRKAGLRTLIASANIDNLSVDEEIFEEYQTVIDQLITADSKLMKPVDKCIRCKWFHE